ncbi:methyltransferase, FkbM family [Lentzea albidocapillata subsp. violacea]|uniref:Methyltransferase, FkbM family n=1 Tax=Lentzea albidocapillata subsp. violacea TaxID=128104 RepID=A0A1G9DE52_9PSEU|nr:FkbM family methyltransferase [Lentzea albidocapillata]SDK62181.1 methyltransferase, FkbM family [Lentzea albidocapillata subsp. violacea]
MISYAQNAEDVLLARLFHGRVTGRYVDVGASDPVEDSVTKHFYDFGWRGINVEPIPAQVEALRKARPGDVTLAIALGAKPGSAVLHHVVNRSGWSTLDSALASTYQAESTLEIVPVEVEVRTLADVLDEHPGVVDFLKIDVEGEELAVIEGADWDRHRPRVVVVEATEPGSTKPAHQAWDPLMTAAGYRCALFDGLNRFYAQADDAEALELLAVPANVFDKYIRADAAEQRAARMAEIAYIRRLEEAVREAEQAKEHELVEFDALRVAAQHAEQETVRARQRIAALEARLIELENAPRK